MQVVLGHSDDDLIVRLNLMGGGSIMERSENQAQELRRLLKSGRTVAEALEIIEANRDQEARESMREASWLDRILSRRVWAGIK